MLSEVRGRPAGWDLLRPKALWSSGQPCRANGVFALGPLLLPRGASVQSLGSGVELWLELAWAYRWGCVKYLIRSHKRNELGAQDAQSWLSGYRVA